MPDRAAELLRAIRSGAQVAGITSSGKTDGGGAQLHAQLSALHFAQTSGVPYFHTPMSTVAHGTADAMWAAAWDRFLDIGRDHPPVPENAAVVAVDDFLDGYTGPPPVVSSTAFHSVADDDADRYLSVIRPLRSRAGLREPDGARPSIAIHIRRGDVTPLATRRYVDDAVVARSIADARAAFPQARVRVFSQGARADFPGLPREGLRRALPVSR